ncbi:MAG: DDE-type integrase/transposase/recombinase [Candidatus Thiodiazotropha taylori]|nr:DDE-type integrase/transposase/recombinase [Candidatus Thiodiazotropha taylori]
MPKLSKESGKRQWDGRVELGGSTPLPSRLHEPRNQNVNGSYINVMINGELEVRSLLDTGAQITLLNEAACEQLKTRINVKPTSLAVNGPSSSHSLDIVGETDLMIGIGEYMFCWPVYICKNLRETMLLGDDFLKAHRGVIDYESKTLRINGKSTDLLCTQTLELSRVSVSETIIIPPRTVCNIVCNVAGSSVREGLTGILEPKQAFEEKYQLGIVKVAAVVQKGKIPVRLFNPNESETKVWKGSSLGNLSPLLDAESMKSEKVPAHCYYIQRNNPNNSAAVSNIGNPIIYEKEDIKSRFPIRNPNIPEKERELHYEILAKHSKVIASNPYDIGCLKSNVIKHNIDTGSATPIKVPVRRMAPIKREIIREEVKTMLENNICEESSSPWSAPVVIVNKKDGGRRFCVDYRCLNEVTKKDIYPLPRADDILESMNNASYFSHFDLVKGYWQIPLAEEAKEKTAFSTPDGHFQFKKLPFGLTNAPSSFQRAMDVVLKGLTWSDCLVYLDDIVIYASTLEEHRAKLEKLLTRFEDAGLKIKPDKCELLPERMKLLGHVISTAGIEVDQEKISVIKAWPTPSNITELRSFLAHCGYYQRFIADYADITAPLRKLDKQNVQFVWNEECSSAFNALKSALCSTSVLAYPCYELPFILDVDASENGLGATLSQIQNDEERPIAFAAKAFQGGQKNYTVYQKEMLALAWGLDHFEPYIYGQQLTVRTDNQALSWLKTTKNMRGPQARWLERIMEFMPFNLEHRPGRLHLNADGLSRFPWDRFQNNDYLEESNEHNYVHNDGNVYRVTDSDTTNKTFMNNWTLGPMSGWTYSEISESQKKDKVISCVLSWLKEGQRPEEEMMYGSSKELWSYWHQFDRLCVKDDALYRIWWKPGIHEISHYQLVLPTSMKDLALYSLHDYAGHLGCDKTIDKIRERFYWFNLRDETELYIKQCLVCQEFKHPQRKPRAPMKNIKGGFPLERLGIDCVGPLPMTEDGNKYITVAVDYFTKYPFAFASSDIKAETVADKLMDHVVCLFGVPMNLHADQGSNFESNVFRKFCELVELSKTRTTPFAPWSNGETERMNRTLISMLKKMVSDNPRKWDSLLQKALMHYRSSIHSSTGFTPYRLMFGREMNLPVDVALNLPSENTSQTIPEYVSKQASIIKETEELARQHLTLAQDRQKEYYDIKKSGKPYKKDDLVMLLVKVIPTGEPRKFYKEYSGPWRVVTVISDVDYRIQYVGKACDKTRGRRRKNRKVVHFNQLKLFYGNLEDTESKKDPDDVVKEHGLVHENNADNHEKDVSDSESDVDGTTRTQESAHRPSLSMESESTSAHRPGPVREHEVVESAQRPLERTSAHRPGQEDDERQGERLGRVRRRLDVLFPENSTRVDRSAQRPPELVDITVDQGQAEQLTDQAHDSEEAGVELDRRVPELNETVVNEGDRSAHRPPDETEQTRPRRNVRLPSRFKDFVLDYD